MIRFIQKGKVTTYNITLLLYSLIFVYPPLSTLWGLGGNNTYPPLFGLLAIVILITQKVPKIFFLYTPILTWGLLMLYHYINAKLKGVPDVNVNVFLSQVLLPWITLVLTVYLCRIDFKTTIKYIFLIFTTVLILIAFSMFRFGLNLEDRLTDENYHANVVGQLAAMSCFVASIYSVLQKKKLRFYISIILIPMFIIVLSQSRNSLILAALAALVYFIGKIKSDKHHSKSKIFTIIGGIAVFFVAQNVIMNSPAGERFVSALNGEIMQSQNKYLTGTIFDTLLGERLPYYVIGFDNFVNNPLTGIGLWNFSNYNNYEYPIHSEYMVHIAEGGLIGAVLYITFLSFFFKSFVKYRPNSDSLYWQLLILFISILFLGMTARIFAYRQFFPMFGIITSYFLNKRFQFQKIKTS